MAISPSSAVGGINAVVSQLRLPGMTAQREANLEQQLVKTISGANPSANWGMIATIANDLTDPTLSTAAANVDISALTRMAVPTTSSTLTQAINTLAGQLRGQSPLPVGVTMLSAAALANASAVTVPSSTGMFAGDTVKITLDNGQVFSSKIATVLGNTINLTKRLPSSAAQGNSFVDTTQEVNALNGGASGTAASTDIVTTLSGASAFGDTLLRVTSAAGMTSGDPVTLQLADGSTLQSTIASGTANTGLTAFSAAGATSVTVASTSGLLPGEAVQITLDNATVFNTTITSLTGHTLSLAAPLPFSASIANNFSATIPPIGGSTTLTANAAETTQSLQVGSTVGMSNGDTLKIRLDNGQVFTTIVASIAGNTVNISAPLPSPATTGASVTDPSNITVNLATPLPVSAASGGTLTDTVKTVVAQQQATHPSTISFSTPLTQIAAGGATSLTVADAGALVVGDTIQVQLDNGTLFNTKISSILGSVVTIATPLPSQASVNKNVTDNISLTPKSTSFTPSVTISPQMQAMLQLQLNVLIGAFNANVNVKQMQTIEATLLSSTLTTAQFQQQLADLVTLATKGASTTTGLSAEA